MEAFHFPDVSEQTMAIVQTLYMGQGDYWENVSLLSDCGM